MTGAVTRGHWHIPWLHGLPQHWGVVASKQLFSTRKELAREADQQLAATQAYGVISQKEFERRVGRRVVQITQNLEKRRHVEKDDFVISMRSFQGGLERAWDSGCIRSSYVVLKPSLKVDVGFFRYLFKSHGYVQALQATSNFIRDGQDLNISNFSLVDLPLPPLDEQRLIARFLDWHGAQTTRLIRAKKKVLALLNEQKQAIIHHAVTRGLDPNVRLKPSGIPWLGDVPEGWDIAHLRYVTRCSDGKRVPLNGTQRGSMQGEYPYWGANRVFDYISEWLFDEPLVLLGEDGAPFFEVGKDVAFAVAGKIWVNNHAHILRCGPRIIPQFLAYALNCVDYRHFISGSTRDKLTQQAMGSISIQLPDHPEQEAIVTYLTETTRELVTAANQIQREITLIQEFRTRLIADVVTGKLDVRATAATLPEAADPEPVEEPEEIDGDDEPGDPEDAEAAA